MGSLDSPDGRWSLFEEAGNLVVRSTMGGGPAVSLTSVGREDHGFGIRPGAQATAGVRPGADLPPVAVWAPDSQRLAVHRLDERRVGTMPLVDQLDGDGHRRPVAFSYRLALAGDRELPTAELWLIDVASGQGTLVDLPAQELLWLTPIELGRVWWSEDCSAVYVITSDRGERAVELHEVDVAAGSTRRILREENASFIELNLDIARPPNVHILPGGREFVWFSERSGWAHLELHDAQTGELIRKITQGEWVVRDLIHVDAARRLVWFTASGREPDRDPYQRHLYLVGLDGGDPVLLTPEDADHEISTEGSEDDWRIIDGYARIDQPTVCVVRDRGSGDVIETRWERPTAVSTAERFTVLARDAATPLYGVMFRPSDFDPDRRYPVIDNIYGFPQTIQTPKRSADGPWQALADCGFIVIVLDGLGTAFRSKTFHDASYGRIQDATLPDHVTALHQLAQRHPWVDVHRVGIYGSSAGGTATARALLEYPETFHVGVAIAGGYDQRDAIAYNLEKYQGPDPTTWAATDVTPLAPQLQGHLLVIWGDFDSNVHPSSSLRLVHAFIEANIDVDTLPVPGADHFVSRHPYVQRRLIEYFRRHLRTDPTPP